MSDHNCYAIIPRPGSDPVFPVKGDANPGGETTTYDFAKISKKNPA